MRYVALLRGINVGGNNKLVMSELKLMCEKLGFNEVSTYINSGNVFFEVEKSPNNILEAMIEQEILTTFKLNIPVLVRSKDQIEQTLSIVPATWENDKNQKTDVLFLWRELDTPDIIQLLSPRQDVDEAIYSPGAVVWRVPRELTGKSALTKIVGTPNYRLMTVRNINTLRAIAKRL